MEKQNIRARQIAIYLENDSVEIEPGAMSYFKGNLEMVSGVTAGNVLGRVFGYGSSITNTGSASDPIRHASYQIVNNIFTAFFNMLLTVTTDENLPEDTEMVAGSCTLFWPNFLYLNYLFVCHL